MKGNSMAKKTEWEIERDKLTASRAKGMKSLTPEQSSRLIRSLSKIQPKANQEPM